MEEFLGTVVTYMATATDNYDGDITDKVTRHEKDNVVTYTVSDSSGNKTTVTRTSDKS